MAAWWQTSLATEDALQDIAPNPNPNDGRFENYLYYIVSQNEIWRVAISGGIPELFSKVNAPLINNIPSPRLTVLDLGFEGDLFAVDGNANPGRVYRIDANGASTLFSEGVQTASEGIAFSTTGSSFGEKLFLSKFDSSPNRISSIDSNGIVSSAPFAALNDSHRLTGLAFAPPEVGFGEFLFGVDHDGTVFKLASDGSYSKFTVSPSIGQNETLAIGGLKSETSFGPYLFVTPDGKGDLIQIDATGIASVFASGFAGFDYRGVTGLKFSKDKKTLFVTDDNAGIIYAITGQ